MLNYFNNIVNIISLVKSATHRIYIDLHLSRKESNIISDTPSIQ